MRSSDSSKKKAGIEALPYIILGIQNHYDCIQKFSKTIVTACLKCLDDPENKIRFTTLKSLYYIAKALEDRILKMFNQIFENIISRIIDLDEEVKGAANFLDKSLHTIIN